MGEARDSGECSRETDDGEEREEEEETIKEYKTLRPVLRGVQVLRRRCGVFNVYTKKGRGISCCLHGTSERRKRRLRRQFKELCSPEL